MSKTRGRADSRTRKLGHQERRSRTALALAADAVVIVSLLLSALIAGFAARWTSQAAIEKTDPWGPLRQTLFTVETYVLVWAMSFFVLVAIVLALVLLGRMISAATTLNRATPDAKLPSPQ